tara:strand:+ start:9015 stop:9425 length:411 start_codon:yes stop_codon:yes gene_type:complete
MPPIRNITQVTLENLHEMIPEYIHGNKVIIQNYDDMKEVYLSMLRDRYLFTLDRDILVHSLIDLTYMFAPGDDVNKDNVLDTITLEDEEDDEEDDDSMNDSDDIVVKDISGMDAEDLTPFIKSSRGGNDDSCSGGV